MELGKYREPFLLMSTREGYQKYFTRIWDRRYKPDKRSTDKYTTNQNK